MKFTPIDPEDVSIFRRCLMPLGPVTSRMLRAIWRRSRKSRSTWFDSRLWRVVWNVNRFLNCTPRRSPYSKTVRFDRNTVMQLDLTRLTDVLALCYGPGEIEVGHACARVCPKDGVVLDIGGNVGTTALSFAASVPSGRVHVFEPSPDMLPLLRHNLELSNAKHVTVHAIGLSDTPSSGKLQVAIEGNPGSAHFISDKKTSDVSPDRPAHDIEVARLDDVMKDLKRLDFVKIDVEGLELRVIAGARSTFERCRPVILFEINESALSRAATSSTAVCEYVEGLGYKLTYLHNGRFRDYNLAGARRSKMHNVIAIPKERAERYLA